MGSHKLPGIELPLRAALLLTVPLFLAWSCVAMELSGRVDSGFVSMTYLNGQLSDLAAREGSEFSPIRSSVGAQLVLWPRSNLGISLGLLSASGAIHGRVKSNLTVVALGTEACGRFSMRVIRRSVSIVGGVGVYSAMLSGLMAGQGLGLGGHIALEVPILLWRELELSLNLAFRYLSIQSIRAGQAVIAPQGMPAIDFSGMYISVILRWRR